MNKIRVIDFLVRCVMGLFWLGVIAGVFFIVSKSDVWRRERVINILSWGNIFDARTLSSFHERTGIKVNVTFYSTNEELLVNLKAAKGHGYDLIVPSDYAIPILRQENLLKKLDKSQLYFLSNINPLLLGHAFDPDNDYALPYMWEIFGIGFDKRYFPNGIEHAQWDLIFKNSGLYKITMLNDAVEAVMLAAYYLYSSAGLTHDQLTDGQRDAILQLLIKQRAWVEAYTDFRPDYFLLTHNCPIVVTSISSILHGMELSKDLGFVIPEDKAFISIEHLAIPTMCSQDDLVYQFLNYAYDLSVIKHHFNIFSSLPATVDVLNDIQLMPEVRSLLALSHSEFQRAVLFFSPLMPESVLHKLWVDVKSR